MAACRCLELRNPVSHRSRESGNVIFFILLGVVLIGLVTAAIHRGNQRGTHIDREQMVIRTAQVKQYAGELERAVGIILQNGASEADIRFASPDAPSDYGTIGTNPTAQVFNTLGGGATYQTPPASISDGSVWEFYGHSHLPSVGTGKADLIAVLPNVTAEFCAKVNALDGYTPAIQPTDSGGTPDTCLHSGAAYRFDDSTQFSTVPNTTDEASFTVKPAMDGCVECDVGGFHYYHVLLAR